MLTEEVFQQYTTTGAFEETDKPTEPIKQQTTRIENDKHDNDNNMHDNDKNMHDNEENMNIEELPVVAQFFRGLTGCVVLIIYSGMIGISLVRLLGNYSEKFRL